MEDAKHRDLELDEELFGILTAISIVSKRLAKKLLRLGEQKIIKEKGESQNDET